MPNRTVEENARKAQTKLAALYYDDALGKIIIKDNTKPSGTLKSGKSLKKYHQNIKVIINDAKVGSATYKQIYGEDSSSHSVKKAVREERKAYKNVNLTLKQKAHHKAL